MTNKEKLLNYSTEKLANELKKIFVENPVAKYVDIKKWLNSDDPELIYYGKKTEIEGREYIEVESKVIFGNRFSKVIDTEQKVIKYMENC